MRNKRRKEFRTVIELGGSFIVTLPKDFCKDNKIKKGDHVTMLIGNKSVEVIAQNARKY